MAERFAAPLPAGRHFCGGLAAVEQLAVLLAKWYSCWGLAAEVAAQEDLPPALPHSCGNLAGIPRQMAQSEGDRHSCGGRAVHLWAQRTPFPAEARSCGTQIALRRKLWEQVRGPDHSCGMREALLQNRRLPRFCGDLLVIPAEDSHSFEGMVWWAWRLVLFLLWKHHPEQADSGQLRQILSYFHFAVGSGWLHFRYGFQYVPLPLGTGADFSAAFDLAGLSLSVPVQGVVWRFYHEVAVWLVWGKDPRKSWKTVFHRLPAGAALPNGGFCCCPALLTGLNFSADFAAGCPGAGVPCEAVPFAGLCPGEEVGLVVSI